MTEEPKAKASAGQRPGPRPDDQDPSGEVAGVCRDLIRCLRLDLDVQVAVEEGGAVTVNFSGPDRPLLLSNAASVLNSLEYLLNRMFWTGKGERIPTILIDSESYRQHREAELVLLAQMASEKVLAQGRPLNLQPMTPRERRIVHLTLAEIEGVRSESDGQGDNRSVTIYPS